MSIWDMHCHLPSRRVGSGTLLEQVERMLRQAERVGIEKLCLFLRVGEGAGPNGSDQVMQALTRHYGWVAKREDDSHSALFSGENDRTLAGHRSSRR